MANYSKKITLVNIFIFIVCLFWPLSMVTQNTLKDSLLYLIPSAATVIAYFLFIRKNNYYFIPLLIIPLISPKLSLFPFFAALLLFCIKKSRRDLVFLLLASTILLFSAKQLYQQSIFISDHEEEQKVLQNNNLYSSVFVSRFFHNKGRIYLDKFDKNIFELTDPTNYFFSFHPGELIGNQNLMKFPFMSLPFLFYGLYQLNKFKRLKIAVIIFISSILSLSVLTITDRTDFILWLPILLFLMHGINYLKKTHPYLFQIFLFSSSVFTLWELIYLISRNT